MDNTKNLTISALTIFVLAIIFSVSLVSAATITVITTTQFMYANGSVVTNTTAGPIQAAADVASAGDTISVVAGVYANALNITTNNITIQSASGYGVTTITNNSYSIVRIGNKTGGANVILDGFTINSTCNGTITAFASATLGCLSVLVHQTNFTIKNSVLQNVNTSIHVDGTTTNITLGLIQNITIQNITTNGGILIETFSQNISGITISKNTFSQLNTTKYGINITGNNTVANVAYAGDTFGIIIDSNFINATKHGITIYNITSVTITNNNISNVSKNGIDIVTLRAVQKLATNLLNHTITIQNNNLSNAGGNGIYICSSLAGYYNTTTTNVTSNIIGTDNRRGLTYACTDSANYAMNATMNYWGDVLGPSNETLLDKKAWQSSGTDVTGNVTYLPWYQDSAGTLLHSIITGGVYYNNIQNAIENASVGATITVGPGIYKSREVNITKNNITLYASSGAAVTTIVFNTSVIVGIGNATNGKNVILDGFTINSTAISPNTNISILVLQTNFTIKGSVIQDSTLGIHVYSGQVNITAGRIENSTFRNITQYGGILLEASKNISGITISRNLFEQLNTTDYAINITGNNSMPNPNSLSNYSGDTFGIVIDSNFINATKHGITIYNVTSVTITNNNITNISKNGVEIVTLRAVQSAATNLYNHTIAIQSNNITGNGGRGLYICSSGAGFYNTTTTTISSNIIVKNTPGLTYACTDATTAALTASNNWWGSSLGPGNNSLNETVANNHVTDGINNITGNVTFTPYYKDVNRTISSNSVMIPASQLVTTVKNFTGVILNSTSKGVAVTVPRATLNVSLDFGYFVNATWEANLSMPINVSVNTTSGVVEMQIATNTTFAGTPGQWYGTFNLPAVTSSNVTPTATTGYTQVVTATYEIGHIENLTTTVESNKAVRINFTNQGTKYIGYVKNSAFTEISSTCGADSQSAGNNLTNWTGDCKITGGNDLIVWTKHFSQYVLYTKTATAVAAAAAAASSGGGSAAVGTATTWTMTYIAPAADLSTGYTKELKSQERVKVMVGSTTHHVGIKSLTTSSAVIEIASDPVSVNLAVGEDAKVDVSADGIYDLYIKLNAITNSKADVTIKSISETIPEGEGAVSTTGKVQETPATGGETGSEEGNLTWLWIVIGIVIVLAIIGVSVKKRK